MPGAAGKGGAGAALSVERGSEDDGNVEGDKGWTRHYFIAIIPSAMPLRGKMQHRRNSDVLLDLLTLDGCDVLDVGSGDGTLCRLMARRGARVTGLECSPRQLAAARAEQPVAGETYVAGVAQQLPFPSGCMDAVVFFNSLHHVPPAFQDQALAEAARVLRSEGLLYLSEPLAQGPFFELLRPIDDETEVRALAYRAICDAARHGLMLLREETYVHTVRHADFESFRTRVVAANAERDAIFTALDQDLRQAFERLGQPSADGGRIFEQPTRANLLRKA